VCEAVIARCDASEVFNAAEHAFDGVAIAVETGRKAILPAAIDLGRDIGRSSLALDFAADGIAVVSLVTVQDVGVDEVIEQTVGGDAIRDLATGQQERDRAAEAIGQRVDFRCPSTARTADRLRVLPPFPPEAQR